MAAGTAPIIGALYCLPGPPAALYTIGALRATDELCSGTTSDGKLPSNTWKMWPTSSAFVTASIDANIASTTALIFPLSNP